MVLKISIEADKDDMAKIRDALPSAELRRGAFEVTIRSERPSEVAEKAKEILERLRPLNPPKRQTSSRRKLVSRKTLRR